jgi:hypothetical protein
VFVPVLLAGLAGAARGHGEPEPHQITVAGEIVCLHCYLTTEEARGPGHADSARRCLEQGQPMGLLADDGTLRVLSAWHMSRAPFDTAKRLAGQQVEVTGVPLERQGVRGLEVRRVGRKRQAGARKNEGL